ncbi:helix-turn-helix transcriptional regulator [Cyanobacteria bacterium FACHB-63]|nr:helix-turn-helix transcriptional regulator [Cyanobacteria bacterium FACHB-63]
MHFPSKTVTEPLEISDLVRELRQRLELTQEQFASELGVTFTTINRWENRHSKPSKMAMMLIEMKVRELGDDGKDLLSYFSSRPMTPSKKR